MSAADRGRRRNATSGGSGGGAEDLAAVELVHGDGARRRVEAQPAEDALVDVLVDDLHAGVRPGVDVDRARLLEPAPQVGVAGDGVVDLDPDEGRVVPHAALLSLSLDFMRPGISEISSATVIPAA